MPSAPNNRRSRRWWPPILAGLTAFVVAALGGATNVATALLPAKWAWAHDPVIMSGLAGGLLVLSVGLAVLERQDDPGRSGGADDRRLHGVVTGSAVSGVGAVVVTGSGQVFIGQGPAADPALSGSAGDRPGRSRQMLAGEIPARPVAFVERQVGADLAGAWDAGVRVCVVQAITGGPGMGKTQAAAAYARDRAAAGWPLVAWVTAETQDQLLTDLSRVAVMAGVADDDGDSAVSARNVRRYLETFPGPALVVFDNATDVDGLSAFLPTVGVVQTVITSRDRAFTRLGVTIDVGLFTPEQSVAYLTDRTGLNDIDGAGAVAADLGHLPLALAQAATVISDHGWDYATFRQRMRTAPAARYLTRHAGDPYPQGAVEAIALALASAGDQDDSGLTRMIIGLLAVLSAEGVSRPILARLADVPAVPSPRGWDEALDRILGRLIGGSILSRSGTGQAFSMHRLVSRVAREREEADGRLLLTINIAADLLRTLQIPEEEGWLRREAGSHLVRQINAVWAVFSGLAYASDPQYRDLTKRLISQRNWSVHQLTTAADLSRAISMGATVLADAERLLGPDHPHTLTSRDNLARAYWSAGRLREAITLYERNLADRERLLGPNHPDTLTSRGNLAGAYWSAGRLFKAMTHFRRNAADMKRALEAGHPARQLCRRGIWEHLFLAAAAVFLILWSAWLTYQRSYYTAIFMWLWLIFIVPGTPIPHMFGRLLASRNWKFMNSPWYQQLLHSASWAARRKHKGQELQEGPLAGDGK